MSPREILLFVCDSLMSGEPEHALLDGARALGPARTAATYHLIDVGASAALLDGGAHAVPGELYALAPAGLAAVDVRRGHPVLHQRGKVRLEDGSEAEAYFVSADQARGVRRIRGGDWRQRPGAPGAARGHDPGSLVRWSKRRFEPR